MNAFTCTGPYAMLILSGVKRVENRRAMPVPAEGCWAISVSKKFSAKEYENFPKQIPCRGNVGMW